MFNGLYRAPQRDMRFGLHDLLDVTSQLARDVADGALDAETLNQVLESADRLCHGVLAPLNGSGDRQGCRLSDHEVTTPAGFREAYQAYREGGWSGLCAHVAHGGQGLPMVVSAVFGEMLGASNIAFALYPRLSANEALRIGMVNRVVPLADLVLCIRQTASGGRYFPTHMPDKAAATLLQGKRLHENLSPRELQIMLLIVQGKRLTEIARQLLVSVKTVSTYRARILEKLKASSNAEMVQYAIHHHLAD